MNETNQGGTQEITKEAIRLLEQTNDLLKAERRMYAKASQERNLLLAFAGKVLRLHRNDGEIGDIDGGTLQELAAQFGFLDYREVKEPCCDNCECAGATTFPTHCYFISELGRRAMAATEKTPTTPGLDKHVKEFHNLGNDLEEWETIRVPKHCIPKGARLIEAYLTNRQIVVLGQPAEDDDHNCDAMGCGSISHVLHRFDLAKPEPVLPTEATPEIQ